MGVWQAVVNSSGVDIDATYGTITTAMYGAGMPPVSHNVSETALLPGALFQSTKVQPRVLQLQFLIPGRSLVNYHYIRKNLLNLFKPDRADGQPIELQYTGTGNAQKIYAYYDGGLEGNAEAGQGFTERLTARFICYDPFFYATTDTTVTLAPAATVADADYIAKRVSGVWSNVNTAFNGTVRAIALDPSEDGAFWCGGDFTNVGSAAGDYIVHVAANGTITALGATPLNGAVHCLAVDAAGDLYVGGAFTDGGGVAAADRIAKWDGANWSALGTGVADGIVYAVCIGHDGYVYIGGSFGSVGGDADLDYIARWNGTAWTNAIGGGTTELVGNVYALALGIDDSIYVGGAYTRDSGDNGISRILNGVWYSMGTGMAGGSATVRALAVGADGAVYAGGSFTTAGGVSVSNIACWRGSAWSALGDGMASTVYALATSPGSDSDPSTLYASEVVGTVARLYTWNGSIWTVLPFTQPGSPTVGFVAITVDADGDLWVGYDTAGTTTLTQPGQTTVTNPGTASAYPTFIVARNGGDSANSGLVEYIRNETADKTLLLNYTIQSGETLTIDLTPGAKSIVSSVYGNVIGRALQPNSDFAAFYLAPGNNTLSVYAYATATGIVTASCEFPAAYWSADGNSTA